MKRRALLFGPALLVLGFAAGWFLRPGPAAKPAPPSAEEALQALLHYHGEGASAARRTITWVDRIVEGGPAMLPELDRALESAPNRGYSPAGFQMDPYFGVCSTFPTLRSALTEAVSRIGGDRAVKVLIREAERQGGYRDAYRDRVMAVLSLVPFADRKEVGDYYEKLTLRMLAEKRGDPEMVSDLMIVRTHLDMDVWDPMANAFRAGWAPRGADDEIAETLATLSPGKAGALFLGVLSDASVPSSARAAAARSLGRMPDYREKATGYLLAQPEWGYVAEFGLGLRAGRFREAEMERKARESGDLERMLAYTKSRVKDLEECLTLLDRIRAATTAEIAARLKIPDMKQELESKVTYGKGTIKGIEHELVARRPPR